MFSTRGLPGPSGVAASQCLTKQPIPIAEDRSTKKPIFRPIPPNGRAAKDWTAIAWPTHIQSPTPDGKFGPAEQSKGWKDCWFMAALAAVANDPDGHQLLAESINKVNGGYAVTFKAAPHNSVFISDAELREPLEARGGDADTRLMELAADKFFKKRGNFKLLFTAYHMQKGWTQQKADQCFEDYCRKNKIQDPMTHNPMFARFKPYMAFFMFTGMVPDRLLARNGTTLQEMDVRNFLRQHITNDRDGVAVVIAGRTNPLGNAQYASRLVRRWDVIRTEITSDNQLSDAAQAFLKALYRWLETGNEYNLKILQSAAAHLKLRHYDPADFVKALKLNRSLISPEQLNVLQDAVLEVLGGGPGYIGFSGNHAGTIEGIDEATNTFTYSEPHFPTLVHTGELSGLIQAIRRNDACLTALKPIIERDDRQHFEHAGTSKGRQLRRLHNQAVRDGKIDQTESGPLAKMMEMDEDAFRQLYDSDKNGVIEGAELKAVQLRVDRWVDHLESTPIW